MTPEALTAARATLGQLWGLDRPLRKSELGRVLRLSGRDPGQTIARWESGNDSISGPAQVAIEALLAGFRPRAPRRF